MPITVTLSEDEVKLINAALSAFENSMDYSDDWYVIESTLLPKLKPEAKQ